jgi:Tol biopolymer transport system component
MNNLNLFLLLLVPAAALPWVLAYLSRSGRARLADKRLEWHRTDGELSPESPAPPARPHRRWGRISVGLLLVLYTLLIFKDDLWYLAYGRATTGTVVQEGKYARRYEFQDAAGKIHRGNESLPIDRYELGESVNVRYVSDDPEQNRLVQSWAQRDLVGPFLFPVIAFAWYGWAFFAWTKAGGAWRRLAEQYPDIGAGQGWRPWWFQSGMVSEVGGKSPLKMGNVLSISAGANGLRFAGQVPIRYLLMPWQPAFVIPWSELRAEPVGAEGVKLTGARVAGVKIFLLAELANAIAGHVGDAWPEAVPEKECPVSPASPAASGARSIAEPVREDEPSEREIGAARETAAADSFEAFFASLQGPPPGPRSPRQPDVQSPAPSSNPRASRLSEFDRAKSVPALTVESRGRARALPPTTLRNVGISKRPGYGAVLLQFSRQRLDFKSSSESFGMLAAMLVGWAVIVWWLASALGAPVAVFFTIVFLIFGVRPLFWGLLDQRRVRLDRSSDAVRIRQFFRERLLGRVSNILAVQLVGDKERIELNLVFGDQARFNLAAIKQSDDRRRLCEHGRELAAFLEVPLVDQVEAMAVVEPAELADPPVAGLAGIARSPAPRTAAGELAAPIAVESGEQLPVRLRGELWQSMPRFLSNLYQVPGTLWLTADRKRRSVFQMVALLNFVMIAGLVIYFFGQRGLLAIAAVAGVWAVAVAVLQFVSWRHRRRLSRVVVEVSAHPLRAGESHEVAVCHPDPRGLKGVHLDLVRMELCFLDELLLRNRPSALPKPVKRVLPERLRMKVGVEHYRQPVSLAEGPRGARQGYVPIPSAAGSLGSRAQRVQWGLAVRLGRWSRWAAVYPAVIQQPAPAGGDPLSLGKLAGTIGPAQRHPADGGGRPLSHKLNARVARWGRYLAVVGIAVALVIWGLPALKKALFPDPVLSVAFSPDGKRLATVSFDGRANESTVTVWDAATGEELLSLKGHPGLVESVAFSPDGRRLACASQKIVKVWDAASGEELLALPQTRSSTSSVAFSPDGQRLAAASDYYDIKVWDAASGREILTIKGQPSNKGQTFGVDCVAFSPDGKLLASASKDHTVTLWDPASGQRIRTWKSSGAKSVAFSPDGKRLASGGSDGIVKVWDAATGKVILTLRGHAKTVRSVAFSPDGKRLASAGKDLTVRVWDAATGQELLTFKGHSRSVESVAFSPDSKRLASASEDGSAKVWDAATGQELLTLK